MERTELLIIGAGQSGLATAHAARERGIEALLLDRSDSPGGSWSRYYDSLALFSPARFSALPGMPMEGDPERYPSRDEVVSYLEAYSVGFSDVTRRGESVDLVRIEDGEFLVDTHAGSTYSSNAVVAATGHFDRPFWPAITGLDDFEGQAIHSADYRSPIPFADSRVVVVGAGNSAVQIAADLAPNSRVTLATRAPIKWRSQRPLGRDIHWWITRSGFDTARVPWILDRMPVSVTDDGTYCSAIKRGEFDRRPMFNRIEGPEVVWADGTRERVDHLILATGYRPNVGYLEGLGALGAEGNPLHDGGISTTVPGLGFVGLEFQRSFSSNTLRGCGRDAVHVVDQLNEQARTKPRPSLVSV